MTFSLPAEESNKDKITVTCGDMDPSDLMSIFHSLNNQESVKKLMKDLADK